MYLFICLFLIGYFIHLLMYLNTSSVKYRGLQGGVSDLENPDPLTQVTQSRQ